jgi:hypothetical protein
MTQLGILLVHATWIKQMVSPFLMVMVMSLQQSLTMCPTIIQAHLGPKFVDSLLKKEKKFALHNSFNNSLLHNWTNEQK